MGGMAAQIPIKNDPEANERGPREGAAGQTARGAGRPRRHLGGASRAGAARQGSLRRAHEDAEPDRTARGSGTDDRRGPADSPAPGRSPRKGCAGISTSGSSISRRGCDGTGLRSDLQPDGGRRDGRDLPRAGLAVGAARRADVRRSSGDGGTGPGDNRRGGPSASGAGRRRNARACHAAVRADDDEPGISGVPDPGRHTKRSTRVPGGGFSPATEAGDADGGSACWQAISQSA